MFKVRKDIADYKFNPACTVNNTKLVQPSIMQSFMAETIEVKSGDRIIKALSFVDDIYLLFNQRRLASAGADTINAWLNTLQSRSDSLSQLRSKCSDSDLMKICKSRFIQSPSELLAWSDYLNTNYESIVSELRSSVDVSHDGTEQPVTSDSQQAAAAGGE